MSPQLSQNQRKMSYSIRHERILLEQAEQDRQQALQDQATTHAANLAEMQQAAETFRTAKEQTYNRLSVDSQKALEAAQAETLRHQGEWATEKKNLETAADKAQGEHSQALLDQENTLKTQWDTVKRDAQTTHDQALLDLRKQSSVSSR
jgi:enolase